MNLILGSGLIGNLARKILGGSWEWAPFKRSRYFSFEIPFADNFVVFDKTVDDFMRQFGNQTPIFYKRPISYQGMLMYQDLPIVQDPYLRKLYGDDVPPLAKTLLRSTFTIYPMSALELHHALEEQHKDLVGTGVRKFGEVNEIDLNTKTITCFHKTTGQATKFEFDKVISTIPLNALFRLCKLSDSSLKAKAICYYHIATDAVDLEGAEQSLVADLDIKFFNVYRTKKNHYVFCTFEPLENPLQYFGGILNFKIDILEARRIEDALPISLAPDLSFLASKGITCVGSNAQWDDLMDVSSCVKRLLTRV